MKNGLTTWQITEGEGPILATAIHNGHELREELLEKIALTEEERLREEDPFTGGWTVVSPTRIVSLQSRFEVDFNRSRDMAVYRKPEDAWGLTVWKEPLAEDCLGRSLAVYDAFYEEVQGLLQRMLKRYGSAVVLDLHSYNHMRGGPARPPADAVGNPEVNLGTGTMSEAARRRWSPLIEGFMSDLREFDYLGRKLDVRENVKFRGGYFPKWIHETFEGKVCALSVEFKKFFMDEWSGRAYEGQLQTIADAIGSTMPGIAKSLREVGTKT